MNKIYIGNLEWSVTEEQIKEAFSGAGTVVEVVIIKDRDTGKSKGFGFVTFDTKEAVDKAVNKFNGVALNRRNILVKVARPREPREERKD